MDLEALANDLASDAAALAPGSANLRVPSALPRPGSPEFTGLAEVLNRSATVPLSPEELDSMKWLNWATNQGFQSRPPAVQRQMVSQYYNKILPYVASSTGETPERYQSLFHANYPEVARMLDPVDKVTQNMEVGRYQLGLEGDDLLYYGANAKLPERRASEFDERIAVAPQLGIEPGTPEYQAFIANGQLPDVAPDEYAERLAIMDQIEADPDYNDSLITPQQRYQYLATGDFNLIDDQRKIAEQEAKDAEEVVEAEAAKKRAVDALEQAEREMDSAIRAGTRALDLMGYKSLDADGNVVDVINAGDVNATTGAEKVTGNYKYEEPPSQFWGLNSPSGRLPTFLSSFGLGRALQFNVVNVENELAPIKAETMFTGLKNLRLASENGSSGLGQLTLPEQRALENRVASLDTGSKPEALSENIRYLVSQFILARDEIRAKRSEMRVTYPDLFQDEPAQTAAPATTTDPATTPAPTGMSQEEAARRLEQLLGDGQ